jgi:hypothetical protein
MLAANDQGLCAGWVFEILLFNNFYRSLVKYVKLIIIPSAHIAQNPS